MGATLLFGIFRKNKELILLRIVITTFLLSNENLSIFNFFNNILYYS